jgi:hypothetical protein
LIMRSFLKKAKRNYALSVFYNFDFEDILFSRESHLFSLVEHLFR